MENLTRVLCEHPFLHGLSAEHTELLSGCTKNVRFDAGQKLFREGDQESTFYLLRQGEVTLEAHHPGNAPVIVETLRQGDVLGITWMFDESEKETAVHHSALSFDAKARDTVIAFALNGACIRNKMKVDDHFGHTLSRRLLERVYLRLARLRVQSLNFYA